MGGFQVGDVVVCIREGSMPCPHAPVDHTGKSAPAKGAVMRVAELRMAVTETGPGAGTRCGCVNLIGNEGRGNASRFRKIRPASDEFIAALRACEPERIGGPINV